MFFCHIKPPTWAGSFAAHEGLDFEMSVEYTVRDDIEALDTAKVYNGSGEILTSVTYLD
jgi:hypothetical protein